MLIIVKKRKLFFFGGTFEYLIKFDRFRTASKKLTSLDPASLALDLKPLHLGFL